MADFKMTTSSTSCLLSIILTAVVSISFLFLRFSHTANTQERGQSFASIYVDFHAIGVPSGPFRWTRAIASSIFSLQKNAYDGYIKHSKRDRAFLLPNIMAGSALLVLPRSLLHLTNRPDSEFLAFDALSENFQFQYMIKDPDVWRNVLQFEVVRRKFGREEIIAPLASQTADELKGDSTEWTELNGWDTCGRIITRTALRIMIGLPACRDDTLLETARLFTNALIMEAGFINCFPPLARPVLGPLLAMRAKYYQAKCQRILIPIVEQRMQLWRTHKEKEDLPVYSTYSFPALKTSGLTILFQNDFLQWLVAKCAATGSEQMDAGKIALRLLHLGTPFIFAMGAIFSQCVFDVHSSPSSAAIISGLRLECERVSTEDGGLSTKASTDKLFRTDSALRESMRLSDVSVTALPRDIVSIAGLKLDSGVTLPKGTRCVFPTQSIHLDEDYYSDAQHYDAFRFSRPFEVKNSKWPSDGRILATSITESFFAFGYGKHACPGRFFVSQMLKQGLAHMLMNYDVEMVSELYRTALGNAMIPPTAARIRVRRRVQ